MLICIIVDQLTSLTQMGGTEDVVAHQQQSTENKTELCIGVQPADNDKMRGSKQELVVTMHKMVEIEDRLEFCISKIVWADGKTIAEVTNTSKQQQQQQSSDKAEFCIAWCSSTDNHCSQNINGEIINADKKRH